MQVGMLTAPFGGDDLKTVLDFASCAGFDALEINATCKHLNVMEKVDAKALKAAVEGAGLRISSLAAYVNHSAADDAGRDGARAILDNCLKVCEKADIPVLCIMAGMPPAGMSKDDCIRQVAAPYLKKLAKKAAGKGIKLAMENWFATNIQHLGHFDLIFNEVDEDNLGLNYDPSHLFHQDIDYLYAVERYASRIFHTHAKDTEVNWAKRRFIGNQAGGWWRYVIPGSGDLDWGVYIARLRANGFNGVLSIEHEDGAVGREEGFKMGLNYLRQWADGTL
jgi:sugar phosphate isomerase/epimerase